MAESKQNKKNYNKFIIIFVIFLLVFGYFFLKNNNSTSDVDAETGTYMPVAEEDRCLFSKASCDETTASVASSTKATVAPAAHYTGEQATAEKESKDSWVASQESLEATAEAVEAVASEDDLTIVVAENNGTATETVAAAQEESRKDDTIIVAVSKETVKEAVEESQQAETAVSENTVAPVENSPVETTNEVVDTAKSNSSTIVVEDCTEISYDDCTGFEFWFFKRILKSILFFID